MKLKPVTPTQSQIENYQRYLKEVNYSIDELKMLASSFGLNLELVKVESIKDYEALVLTLLDAGKSVDEIIELAASYLGEVFRNEIGGCWELCLKDKKYLYFGLPVISNYADYPIEFCPSAVLRNFCLSKEPGLINSAINSHREFVK